MFDNKIILITGGTGSWGNELTAQLIKNYNPKEIRIYSRGEHKQVEMRIKFHQEKRLKFIIGDVRDKNRLNMAMKNVDYVFHLAALKHVPVCEENAWESVLTNIYGVQNVIETSIENNVKKVIDISTDKAVDPLNLYGVCKSVGEKLIIASNLKSENTSFVCIRAGNVLGTNGSVVPLFKDQILTNNEITLTDEKMTRYFLTLSDAIRLIFRASEDSVGGEIFVMKMPSVKIIELAEVMIKSLGNQETKITKIGIRPGEKIHELLVSRYESPRAIEKGDYYVILPMLDLPKVSEKYANQKPISIQEFSSKSTYIMNRDEIEDMLKKGGFLASGDKSKYFNKELSPEELKNIFKFEGWQRNGIFNE